MGLTTRLLVTLVCLLPFLVVVAQGKPNTLVPVTPKLFDPASLVLHSMSLLYPDKEASVVMLFGGLLNNGTVSISTITWD